MIGTGKRKGRKEKEARSARVVRLEYVHDHKSTNLGMTKSWMDGWMEDGWITGRDWNVRKENNEIILLYISRR